MDEFFILYYHLLVEMILCMNFFTLLVRCSWIIFLWFLHLCLVLLFLINLIENYKIKCFPRGLNPKLLHQSLDLTNEMVFKNWKIYRCQWGLNPESLSPESLSYTTRPPSHNSESEYVVYIQCAACELLVNSQYSILLTCTLEKNKKWKNNKKMKNEK